MARSYTLTLVHLLDLLNVGEVDDDEVLRYLGDLHWDWCYDIAR